MIENEVVLLGMVVKMVGRWGLGVEVGVGDRVDWVSNMMSGQDEGLLNVYLDRAFGSNYNEQRYLLRSSFVRRRVGGQR